LAQLHSRSIAHQDIKPSNVLVFEEMTSKIADLGRASMKDRACPHDGMRVPGANSYAPPELLYRFESPDWDERRLGCDLYLLGSLVFFFFTGIGATGLILRNLDDALHPTNWRGMFHDALPFLIDAFEKALNDLRKDVPNPFTDAVVGMARQLCYPDPALRGHPKVRAQAGARFSLERYISEFNALASRAEIEFRKVGG
jgi:serine/threonine protein kinase